MNINKLKKKYINDNSKDYKEFSSKIFLQYNLCPAFILLVLFFLLAAMNDPSARKEDLKCMIFLGVLALLAWLVGSKKNNYLFNNMLKRDVQVETDKLIMTVKKEKRKRKNSVIMCIKWMVWITSFLVIDSLADNVRQSFSLHTFNSFIAIIGLLIVFMLLLFIFQRIIYTLTVFFQNKENKMKEFIKGLVDNGMFVSGYIDLTVIQKGLSEHNIKRKLS